MRFSGESTHFIAHDSSPLQLVSHKTSDGNHALQYRVTSLTDATPDSGKTEARIGIILRHAAVEVTCCSLGNGASHTQNCSVRPCCNKMISSQIISLQLHDAAENFILLYCTTLCCRMLYHAILYSTMYSTVGSIASTLRLRTSFIHYVARG